MTIEVENHQFKTLDDTINVAGKKARGVILIGPFGRTALNRGLVVYPDQQYQYVASIKGEINATWTSTDHVTSTTTEQFTHTFRARVALVLEHPPYCWYEIYEQSPSGNPINAETGDSNDILINGLDSSQYISKYLRVDWRGAREVRRTQIAAKIIADQPVHDVYSWSGNYYQLARTADTDTSSVVSSATPSYIQNDYSGSSVNADILACPYSSEYGGYVIEQNNILFGIGAAGISVYIKDVPWIVRGSRRTFNMRIGVIPFTELTYYNYISREPFINDIASDDKRILDTAWVNALV